MTKEFDLKVLKIVVGSKKFLLILDDIREENHDISKREDVFAPSILTYWILVTARIDLLTSTTQTTHKRTKMMNQVVRGITKQRNGFRIIKCLTLSRQFDKSKSKSQKKKFS
ncbi:hypothetical protein IEQ34_010523 [Dendrobium chrysotoxum]|uniref:Uncharacterized protein n=1 Tax=Dendrobium chrysotoxum TaxID=161865 RepID=A0AAV7GXB1_DENCH|nr:hypothetical protein IEQ34_010523 [Dendrobium chrysotoxum]